MSSIILITTYSRPDYLRLCLEYLSRATGITGKEIWICIDRGGFLYREISEVLNDFRPQLNIRSIVRKDHSYIGNTYNTLEAYKEAYQTDAKYVYLVEDDVLVQPDFFQWHEAVQEIGDYFCSIAYRCMRNSGTFVGCTDPTAYFTSRKDYASIGVCWKREKLATVVEHARHEYYSDLSGYLAKHFPNNRFADSFSEQDGLVMRLLGATNDRVCAWSCVPRCYHVGFNGYNRPRGARYSYQELKEIIHDAAKIKAASVDFADIEPVPTELLPEWDATKLHCIQEFK